MSTNKVVLRSIDQFMADYVPIYKPLYGLFLQSSQQYDDDVGQLNFKRIQTVGDIRGHHFTPKDTEIRQVSVDQSSKTFKKYYMANQFSISTMQNQFGVEATLKQVLDEYQRHMDDLFLLGEGTSSSNMINNGLFYSNDTNYDLESSAAIALDNRLYDLHNKVLTSAAKADLVAGRKVIIFYGTDILPLFNSLFDTAVKPFKVALQEVLGSNYSLVQMPPSATPSSVNGWIIANLDQVKMHYTLLPTLKAQGVNEEKLYYWFNFMTGSSMLEVLAPNAVIRQPTTLALS